LKNKKNDDKDDFDVDNEDQEETDAGEGSEKKTSRVLQLASSYRSGILPRDVLMEYCNAVMKSFESAEEAERISRKTLSEPDEDGFITVTTAATVGSKRELEVDGGIITRADVEVGRRSGHKRSRKKKTGTGAAELTDFYRFQRRETRQKGLQDLRKRFEEDLETVKKIKEQKLYRPFSG